MRVYLDQIGCRLNFSEMETLAHRLRTAGHVTVAAPEEAQVIVFNSCAVTSGAERDSRKRVGQLHRANPAARIAVTGCWATLRPRQAATLPGVALITQNGQKALLHTLLEPWSAEFDDAYDLARLQPDGGPFVHLETASDQRRRTRAFVKVQDGCNNRCTFCIVTALRGESRSRPLDDVVREIQRLADEGVVEAVLTGVHLGSYGRDLCGDNPGQRPATASSLERAARTARPTPDLAALIAAILSRTNIPRLRLSSLEPWELADGFFDLWAQWPDRLCPHLHLPLQAGTGRQLRAMARRCTTASYRRLVQEARAAIPDLILTTDLIAGFPGESEADFEEGLAFVEEMRFAHAHIFPFSAREGTAAARYGDQVPRAIKKERLRRLQAVVERTGQLERQRFVGEVRPVLWEGDGKPAPDGTGRIWSGLTDNYLRVTAVAPEPLDLHNRIVAARLDGLEGEVYQGTLLSEIVAPDRAAA
ncbi:MAG: MiaB/RimO family radical SAM methylthiotransferase [Caldilineaceae bacterium]|nr:MiaB/RimO family radical SAM methylthiotransferase [Caldilineaceae bacterium]